MSINVNVQELAREIAARLAPDALLSAEDVAALLKCSPAYVREKFANAPRFPPAIRLAIAGGGRGHPRWRRSEIMEWIDLQAQQSVRSFKSGAPRKIIG